MLDIVALRRQFPALSQDSNEPKRVRLDNAATTSQPRAVIAATSDFCERGHAPDAAAALHADARVRIAHAVGASDPVCVVFCASATHAIDLVARSWGDSNVGDDDEIIVSSAEHVANLACWQDLALRRRARLRIVPVDADGAFPLQALRQALSPRTKLVAVTHVSNVSGTVFPVREIVAAAHAADARVLIDGAQAVAHMPVEFDGIGADFYAFSGHKAFAPTGIGVLLGKSVCLDALQPAVLGANAFEAFTLDSRSLAGSPNRFEGGTADIAGAMALADALEFIQRLGWDEIMHHERRLCAQLDAGLASIEGVCVLGSNRSLVGIRSFVVHDRDSVEICRRLQDRSVIIRAGHLSAQTLLRQFGADDALRVSVAVYNDAGDIDRFIAALAASVR
ncbi:MAG TPA: aminotransferase class V-fold PLP-dependent enzyme [Rudaea sp.]|jgi:cysteine desulfurase/selenocysteine lyase